LTRKLRQAKSSSNFAAAPPRLRRVARPCFAILLKTAILLETGELDARRCVKYSYGVLARGVDIDAVGGQQGSIPWLLC
jgi:hypothetical protein